MIIDHINSTSHKLCDEFVAVGGYNFGVWSVECGVWSV